MQSVLQLPPPPDELLQLSHRLGERIIDEIRSHGPMPFDRYMQMALYEPSLGYYVNGLHKFGAQGDFVTAPEQGPLFARVLARQIQQVVSESDMHQAPWAILELGAGSGVLARDILAHLDTLPSPYWILEPSAFLREVQKKTLEQAGLAEHVMWLNEPPQKPFNGVVIGNEVIDALPVKRWRLAATGIEELAVDLEQSDSDRVFRWVSIPASKRLTDVMDPIIKRLPHQLPLGYESDCLVDLKPWLKEVTHSLESGVVLFIDYGYDEINYYHPERSEGTVVCHYRHRAHFDPFVWPGLTDLSAFVNFTAVAEAATSFDRVEWTSQAEFVLSHGVHHEVADIADDATRLSALSELKRLTLPGEMGEKFKVMGLTRGNLPLMKGFSGSIE